MIILFFKPNKNMINKIKTLFKNNLNISNEIHI